MSAAENPAQFVQCTKCRQEREVVDYFFDKRRGRLAMPCKPCRAAYHANLTIEQRDRKRETTAAWRAANADREKERARRWWIKNSETAKAKAAAWRAANPDRMKAARDSWRNANRDLANRMVADWQKRNLDAHRAKENRRRARKAASGGSHTAADIRAIRKAQRGACATCRVALGNRYHVDHVVPLKLGGSNDRKNIQILCAPCNLKKGAKHPAQFMRELGFLV